MRHKVFVSFKILDESYRDRLINHPSVDVIDKSLSDRVPSFDEDYVMRVIREKYLLDSTITIFLIGRDSSEFSFTGQEYIKRELQASLMKSSGKQLRNGVLGIVLPPVYDRVYPHGSMSPKIDATTTIDEFSYNYHLDTNYGERHYCEVVKWHDFIAGSEYYLEKVLENREDKALSDLVKVRP